MALRDIGARLRASTSDGGSKRILTFGGIAVVAALAWVMFSPAPAPVAPSSVPSGPTADTVQGSGPITPAYETALQTADQERLDAAQAGQGTAIPTVRPSATEPLLPVEVAPAPIQNPPQVAESEPLDIEQVPVVVQQPAAPVPLVAPAAPLQDQQAVQEVATYMQSVRRELPVATVERWAQADPVVEEAQSAPAATAAADAGAPESKVTLPLSGTILYATLVGRANSDAPGPVLAEILQGPYAGARLIGSFEAQRESLVISFDKMTVGTTRDGEEINETVDIEAVAVDVTHVGTALASSVDRHMFEKVAFGFAGAFAQGFGEAVSQSGSITTLRSDGSYTTSNEDLDLEEQLLSAGGKAVGNTGQVLQQEFGNRPTTIIVNAGTPLGVLFL